MRAVLAVLALAAALPVVPAAPACAGQGPRAALVIDVGDEKPTTTYCVALGDDEVSGIELIELAGRQHELQYALGSGGRAVCMLEGVGASGDDCFGSYPDFWGYWRGNDGGWTWSSVGAAGSVVEDGDVDGWSWGSGDDGSTHPQPPAKHWAAVCPAAEKPAPAEPEPPPAAAPDAEPEADPAPEPAAGRAARPRPKLHRGGISGRARIPVVTASPAPAGVRAEPARNDSPASRRGGIVAIATAATFALAAVFVARRRRARGE